MTDNTSPQPSTRPPTDHPAPTRPTGPGRFTPPAHWAEEWNINNSRVVDLGGPRGPRWAEGEDEKGTPTMGDPTLIYPWAWRSRKDEAVGLWVTEEGIVCYTTSPHLNYTPKTYSNIWVASTREWAKVLESKRFVRGSISEFERMRDAYKLRHLVDDAGQLLTPADNTTLWQTYGACVGEDGVLYSRDEDPWSGENIALAEEAFRRWQDICQTLPICHNIGPYPVPEALEEWAQDVVLLSYWELELDVARLCASKYGEGERFDSLFLPVTLATLRSWVVAWLLAGKDPVAKLRELSPNVDVLKFYLAGIVRNELRGEARWCDEPTSSRPVTILSRTPGKTQPWQRSLADSSPLSSGR